MPRLADVALASFYADAAREYDRAAEHGGVAEPHLRFGGRMVRLRISCSGLIVFLLGALAHRADEDGGPMHATISSWQEPTCSGRSLRPPWRAVDIGPGGLVRGSDGEGVVAVHETYSGSVTL